MKFFSLIILLLGATATAWALSDEIPKGVVAANIYHKRQVSKFGKRDESNNIYGSYIIVYGVGTPQQLQSGIVDTGSSDLWINGPWNGQTPFYNPAKSTSYQYDKDGFYISYGSGEASGYWISENINIAGSTLKNQQMGLVNNRDAGQAIFGVGMVANEVSNTTYDNVPQNLYKQGLTKTNAYSIYLDNLKSSTGRILFGGLDSNKYTGSLHTIPITHNASFHVDVNEIQVNQQKITNGTFSGLMDSGTTFCYLPTNIARKIAKQFQAKLDISTGLYFVQSTNQSNDEIIFNFSGAQIKVPATEMLVEARYIIQGNSPAPYVLGIVETNKPPYIIGDTFFRSAYMVFDITHKTIAIAQASYDSNANIIAITESGIPGALPAPGYEVDNRPKSILTIGKANATAMASYPTSSKSPKWPWWWPN